MTNEIKDICYGCGKIQEYGTMKDLNAFDFDIYCDKCYKKILKKKCPSCKKKTIHTKTKSKLSVNNNLNYCNECGKLWR